MQPIRWYFSDGSGAGSGCNDWRRLLRFSISLGADERKIHTGVSEAQWFCILASVLLTALYFLFRDPILTMFGGRVNEETFRYSKEYFIYISMGIPFYMFGQAMNPIIRSMEVPDLP